jgi:hypothetical protein
MSNAIRLSRNALGRLPALVDRPAYDSATVRAGTVIARAAFFKTVSPLRPN